MNEHDRTERVQRAVAIFSRMMRPHVALDDPEAEAKIARHVETLDGELAAIGLSHDELEEVQVLYFQGLNAVAPLADEQFAKSAFLVKHAPGASSFEEAYTRLTEEQRAEFASITAEDLGKLDSRDEGSSQPPR